MEKLSNDGTQNPEEPKEISEESENFFEKQHLKAMEWFRQNKLELKDEPYLEDKENLEKIEGLIEEIKGYQELFADDLTDKDQNVLITELGILDDLKPKINEIADFFALKILNRIEPFSNLFPKIENKNYQTEKEAMEIFINPLWQELMINFRNSVFENYKELDELSRKILGQTLETTQNKVAISYFYRFIKDFENKYKTSVEESNVHQGIIEALNERTENRGANFNNSILTELFVAYYQTYFWHRFETETKQELSQEELKKYQEISKGLFEEIKEIARTNQTPLAKVDLTFQGKNKKLFFSGLPIESFQNTQVISRIILADSDYDEKDIFEPTIFEVETEEQTKTPMLLVTAITEKGVDFGISRYDGQIAGGAKANLGLEKFFKNLNKESLYEELRAEVLLKLWQLLINKEIDLIIKDFADSQSFLKALKEQARQDEEKTFKETKDFFVVELPQGMGPSKTAQKIAREAGLELKENETIQFKGKSYIKPEELIESIASPKKENKQEKTLSLRPMKYRAMVFVLERLGCRAKARQQGGKGDHVIWLNPRFQELPENERKVLVNQKIVGQCPIPDHGSKDLQIGLINGILKELHIEKESFLSAEKEKKAA